MRYKWILSPSVTHDIIELSRQFSLLKENEGDKQIQAVL